MLYLFRNLWTVHHFYCHLGLLSVSSSYYRNAITGTWASLVFDSYTQSDGVN